MLNHFNSTMLDHIIKQYIKTWDFEPRQTHVSPQAGFKLVAVAFVLCE